MKLVSAQVHVRPGSVPCKSKMIGASYASRWQDYGELSSTGAALYLQLDEAFGTKDWELQEGETTKPTFEVLKAANPCRRMLKGAKVCKEGLKIVVTLMLSNLDTDDDIDYTRHWTFDTLSTRPALKTSFEELSTIGDLYSDLDEDEMVEGGSLGDSDEEMDAVEDSE